MSTVASPAAASNGSLLARDVRALLWSLDPARHDGAAPIAVREDLMARIEGAAREGLAGAAELEHALARDPDLLGGWDAWRRAALPAYEAFAATVRASGGEARSLRPSNPVRAAFHVAGGTTTAMLVEHVLPLEWLVPVAAFFTALAWGMELSRRLDPRINRFLMALFGPVAHAHEAWRVNSATWFSTALLLVAAMGSPIAAVVAFLVLGWADPAAGIVGRRFGRVRLVHGRSLEGTLTFAAVGTLVAYLALWMWHPELSVGAALAIAAAGAVPAAVAELFARRIDDNLAIPLTAAVGVLAATAWMV
jgi:dolichol kinase